MFNELPNNRLKVQGGHAMGREKENPIRIVSGGQSGVDRAALDAALALGIACGGWCPHGRKAEDGPIPERYPLRETPLSEYAQRTAWNVRDSDGTLILLEGRPTGGTAFTIHTAAEQGLPIHIVDLADPGLFSASSAPEFPIGTEFIGWILENRIFVLNVAGPRESLCPGIHGRARAFLETLLPRLIVGEGGLPG